MKQLDAKKLIRKLKDSDVNAFNELFAGHYEKVYNFCLKLLHQKEDAEEVTQEVFVTVWQNRKNIDLAASFSSYLFGIAKNKIYNLYRKSLYVHSYIKYISWFNGEFDYVTEDEILFKELSDIFNNLIEKLPEKRREVFKLSRIQGYSYKEIAGELNISENTVDVQIRKSLDFIRQEIKRLYKIT